MKLLGSLTFLIVAASISWGAQSSLILRDFIKGDHLVLLTAPEEAVKNSKVGNQISTSEAMIIAKQSLKSWYSDLEATVGNPTVREEVYRYVHTHPPEQKNLMVSYFWCSAMVAFGESPTTFHEIDFLVLRDGTVFRSQRDYRPEFLYYDVSYRNGVLSGAKRK
ncbi:MAG: hypothetical protein AAGH40_13805 [Verrucomicrobiota bacterium]